MALEPVTGPAAAQINNWDDFRASCEAAGGEALPAGSGRHRAECVPRSSGGGSGGGYDAAAAERARIEAAQREAARREAEERAADEARERAEAARQKFIEERDAATLRGTGTNFFSSELRGSGPETPGIRDLKPERSVRDLSGPLAAWKQLNCAAYIVSDAFAGLRPERGTDIEDFNELSKEALNALQGRELGVQCPGSAPKPRAFGRQGYEEYKNQYRKLLERSRKLADELKLTMEARRTALEKLLERRAAAESPSGEVKPQAANAKLLAAKAKLDEFHAQNEKTAEEAEEAKKAAPEDEGDGKSGKAMAAALAAKRAAELSKMSYAELTKHEQDVRNALAANQAISQKVEAGDAGAGDLLASQFGNDSNSGGGKK